MMIVKTRDSPGQPQENLEESLGVSRRQWSQWAGVSLLMAFTMPLGLAQAHQHKEHQDKESDLTKLGDRDRTLGDPEAQSLL